LLTLRFKQLLALRGLKRFTHLPAACAAAVATTLACAGARRVLRRNVAQHLSPVQPSGAVGVPQLGAK
jgi:hypothetical protein